MIVKNLIVCDDVRVEQNGKHILIGTYTRDFVFDRLPSLFAFMVWFQVEYEDEKSFAFSLRARAHGDQGELFKIGGNVDVAALDTRDTLFFGPLQANIGSKGIITFEYQINGREWIKIQDFQVLTAADMPAAVGEGFRRT